jgi:hypothetical protein
MHKENVVHIHNGIWFIRKVKWNYIVCRKMDGTEDHQVKWNKPDSERQIPHAFSDMQNLDLKKQSHECKRRTVWWDNRQEGERQKEKVIVG